LLLPVEQPLVDSLLVLLFVGEQRFRPLALTPPRWQPLPVGRLLAERPADVPPLPLRRMTLPVQLLRSLGVWLQLAVQLLVALQPVVLFLGAAQP
jgi:hypothetical protein